MAQFSQGPPFARRASFRQLAGNWACPFSVMVMVSKSRLRCNYSIPLSQCQTRLPLRAQFSTAILSSHDFSLGRTGSAVNSTRLFDGRMRLGRSQSRCRPERRSNLRAERPRRLPWKAAVVAPTFLSAGTRDFPVPCCSLPRGASSARRVQIRDRGWRGMNCGRWLGRQEHGTGKSREPAGWKTRATPATVPVL